MAVIAISTLFCLFLLAILSSSSTSSSLEIEIDNNDTSTNITSLPELQPEEVCLSGYVMDTFCIKRGTLLDAPDLESLKYPAEHTIHCLVDIPICVESGYEMLKPDETREGWYTSVAKLNSFGNEEVVRLATEERMMNGDAKGFRATVVGTLDTSTTPPSLIASTVLHGSVDCPASLSLSTPTTREEERKGQNKE